jgi:tryptophanyl-tRNA synthetase
MEKQRILSGMQPTQPKLHLGNYEPIKSWVRLQEEYKLYTFVADWHSLTTMHENPRDIAANSREIVKDYLAAGIDPERSTIFLQSHVPEHAELHLLFSMITPLGWLERVPTYKEKKQNLQTESEPYGLLGYPVLQAADILLYKPYGVPVGKDQAPHLELSREIARRFNHLDGEVFPEFVNILCDTPVLMGIDGRKMSKSYGNTINLSDPADTVTAATRQMVTDPARVRRSDPGNPEVCSVFAYHKLFTPDRVEEIAADCRSAGIGCTDCKKILAGSLNSMLDPMRERRAQYESKPGEVAEILEAGTARARTEAQATMAILRERLNLVSAASDTMAVAAAAQA